jgi:hypothetical protein
LTLFGGEDWSLAPFSLVSVKGQSRSVFLVLLSYRFGKAKALQGVVAIVAAPMRFAMTV